MDHTKAVQSLPTVGIMAYVTFENPYPNEPKFLTPAVLKRAYGTVMDQMPERIENISSYMREMRGYVLTPDSPLSKFDELPGVLASLGRMVPIFGDDYVPPPPGQGPNRETMLKVGIPIERPDSETVDMISDASLLWGEAFRRLYPDAQWAIGAKPKSSIDFGYPLIIGIDEHREQFNTRLMLYGDTCCLLLGLENDKSISWLTNKWASLLGFIEDPYPTPMSALQEELRSLSQRKKPTANQ